MKKFVVAPDSFKESMTAKMASEAMSTGIKRVFPDGLVSQVPLADGGEGLVSVLLKAIQGHLISVMVKSALPEKTIKAVYALSQDGQTAVIEMAAANGLATIPLEKRDPWRTSTFGTGELMRAALDQKVKKIILGLGGSATNDGGAGMLQALGGRLLQTDGQEIGLGGGKLADLDRVDLSGLDPRLNETEIIVASDVMNPLTGKNGATYVFGQQKGAPPSMLPRLENNLQHFAAVLRRDTGCEIEEISGAGAAGGLGGGLFVFPTAVIRSGVELVIEMTHLEEKIAVCDYVFTGEGKLDSQTKFGKVPLGVARIAKKYQKPVFVCAGQLGTGISELYDDGITAAFGILSKNGSLTEILAEGPANLAGTTENIARILALGY